MEGLQLQQALVTAEGNLLLSIKPSSTWSRADVDNAGSLVQHRNQFVCMQLATMVKEQHAKYAAAMAAGDAAGVHAGRFMFLASLSAAAPNSTALAAALFYPRACSKDSVELPHVYAELVVCNSPGKGLGSLLLQHVEQFVADNCDTISEGFFGSAATLLAAPDAAAYDAGSTPAQHAGQQGPCAERRSYSSLPVLLPGDLSTLTAGSAVAAVTGLQGLHSCLATLSLSGSSSSVSSLASTGSSCSGSTAPSTGSSRLGLSSSDSCVSLPSAQDAHACLTPAAVEPELSCSCGVGLMQPAATAVNTSHSSSSLQQPRASVCAACMVIQGIKLLSVQSAQAFYSKCGYGAPDSCCEMFKPLPAAQHGSAPAHQRAF